MSEQAVVREVGLRDRFQSLAEIMPTEDKTAGLDTEHLAAVCDIAARALPEVGLHGAMARAGLPKDFCPMRPTARAAQ